MGVGEKEAYSSCQGTPRSSYLEWWVREGGRDGMSEYVLLDLQKAWVCD